MKRGLALLWTWMYTLWATRRLLLACVGTFSMISSQSENTHVHKCYPAPTSPSHLPSLSNISDTKSLPGAQPKECAKPKWSSTKVADTCSKHGNLNDARKRRENISNSRTVRNQLWCSIENRRSVRSVILPEVEAGGKKMSRFGGRVLVGGWRVRSSRIVRGGWGNEGMREWLYNTTFLVYFLDPNAVRKGEKTHCYFGLLNWVPRIEELLYKTWMWMSELPYRREAFTLA